MEQGKNLKKKEFDKFYFILKIEENASDSKS
jgi:hypothetical protein